MKHQTTLVLAIAGLFLFSATGAQAAGNIAMSYTTLFSYLQD